MRSLLDLARFLLGVPFAIVFWMAFFVANLARFVASKLHEYWDDLLGF